MRGRGVDAPTATLAIVAPSFDELSETFVADHVETLAPGRTVLVCTRSLGAERFGCPVLSQVGPELAAFGPTDRAVKRGLAALRRRIGPGLCFDDRMRVIAFFREHRVTHVLGEFGYSGAQMVEVCESLALPLHVYFRGSDASAGLRRGPLRRRYRRMFPKIAGIFCVSQDIADRLIAIGAPPEKIVVNPSGAVIEAFAPGTPESGCVVAVGRLVEKKAPHLTVEAFAGAAARFPEARLDIVGDGPLEPEVRAAIDRRGLGDRVTLHGALPHREVGALLRRAAVFVQHSRTAANSDMEGFPTAIAEAMSSGLPIVATRHGGIPEHVQHGETGLLVEEGDVDGMAAALARLLADPAEARAMGAAGRAHAVARLDRAAARRRVRDAMGLPDPDGGREVAPDPGVSRS